MRLMYMPTAIVLGIALLLPSQPAHSAEANLHNRLLKLKDKSGNDHRTIVDSTKTPWRAIGRLNRRGGGHCTATVIAPNLVLTAAHCLWNKRTRNYVPAQALHFVAGWSKGEYLFHSKAKAVRPAAGYEANMKKGIKAFTHDWAVVELIEDPAPVTGLIRPDKSGPSKFQPRTAKFGPYTQAGYSADKRHVLTAHINCPIWGIEKNLNVALHACDALPGDSGSPIVVPGANGIYKLIAIHVGYAKTSTSGTGIAVPAGVFLESVAK